MTERTAGDVVVDVLARSGVEVVFGIPSVHNLPIYDAIRRDSRIRAMSVRLAQGAVGAADGFARTTGRLGVCLTSTGPGAANAMGGQLERTMHRASATSPGTLTSESSAARQTCSWRSGRAFKGRIPRTGPWSYPLEDRRPCLVEVDLDAIGPVRVNYTGTSKPPKAS